MAKRKPKKAAKFEFKPFSAKALEVIEDPLDAQITCLEGSVRASKTIASIVRWGVYVKEETSPGAQLMMIGVTEDTLYRNVIRDLVAIFGEENAVYREGLLTLFGREVHCLGAIDKGAEKRVRGATLEGAYVDEATQIPIEVLRQLVLRCSAGRGRLIWTTNPDSPYHPVFTEYIGNEAKIKAGVVKVHHFTMNDNLALSEEYKANIAAGFTGLWYKRFVLGLWVIAEGVIYDAFDVSGPHGFDDADLPRRPDGSLAFDAFDVSIDYGTQNAFVALLWGVKGDESWLLIEYYYSGRDEMRQLTDGEYSEAVAELVGAHRNAQTGKFEGGLPIRYFIVDPSAASFKAQLRKDGFKGLLDAVNDVIDGIKATMAAFKGGKLRIHRKKAPNTVRELGLYMWDKKAAEKAGEDKPMKVNDHGPDAVRYHRFTVFGRAPRKARASAGV